MKTKHFFLFLLGAFLFYACEKSPENVPEKPLITKPVFSGYVQKGPYINGSSVTVTLLDEQLNQTGTVFSTQIADNAGNFEQRNIGFASDFIELKADGYYFDEVRGINSAGSLTLYALADVTNNNSFNINILTHLERQRIIYLIQNNGLSFPEAKKQAGKEVLEIFKFVLPEGVASESLTINDDALLLAVSVIVQGYLTTGDLTELLANISADIRTDGKLNNPALCSQLMNNAAYINQEEVLTNMKKKYSELGKPMKITDDALKSHVTQFMNNSGYKLTLGISYPKEGKWGPNILADDLVDVKRLENNWPVLYSVKAELPAGNSNLKIVIRSETAYPYGGYGYNNGSEENWLISPFDIPTKGNTWTVYESGKHADAAVVFDYDCIVEFYENGATTPTKVKEIKVIDPAPPYTGHHP